MTLQNLANTWGLLAPDEVLLRQTTLDLILLKNSETLKYVCIDPSDPRSIYSDEHSDAAILQHYLQKCILERNWIAELYFSLDGSNISSAAKVAVENSIGSSIDVRRLEGHLYREYWSQSSLPSIIEALLSAYILALAMQRSITPGKWTHFKGGTVNVITQANFAEKSNGTFVDNFVLEDKPDSEASLFSLENGTYEFTIATPDLARLYRREPLIFYLEDDRKWARKSELFLGLIDGNLRFVKSADQEELSCPNCGTKHIDKDTAERNWSTSPHQTHLCLLEDGGCGTLFESKSKCIGK